MNRLTDEEQDRQTVRQLEHFVRTADVSEIPLIGFDQTGRWIGMKQRTDGTNFPRKLTKKISNLKVPDFALISTNALGQKTLHGSFVLETEEPVLIDFHEVVGNIIVRSTTNPDFHEPNLLLVHGMFDVMSGTVNMPELLNANHYMKFPRTKRLNAPALILIEGTLLAIEVVEFDAPSLYQVGGDLLLYDAVRFRAPKLDSVGRHLLAEQATSFDAPNLKYVGGILDTFSAAGFYLSDIRVGEKWRVHPEARKLFLARKARDAQRNEPDLKI